MNHNMDSDDKTFFSKILDSIEKRLEKIEQHQEKTCDELDTVDKNVIELKTSFKDHIEYGNKIKENNDRKHVHKREWLLVAIAIIVAVIAIVK